MNKVEEEGGREGEREEGGERERGRERDGSVGLTYLLIYVCAVLSCPVLFLWPAGRLAE